MQLTVSFSLEAKVIYLLLLSIQHEFFAMDSSHTRTNSITNPRVWSLSLKILPSCGLIPLILKTITKHQHKRAVILISKATSVF